MRQIEYPRIWSVIGAPFGPGSFISSVARMYAILPSGENTGFSETQWILNPGVLKASSTNFRIAAFPSTTGWPGSMMTASSVQYDTTLSTFFAAVARSAQCASRAMSFADSAAASNGGAAFGEALLHARESPPTERPKKIATDKALGVKLM